EKQKKRLADDLALIEAEEDIEEKHNLVAEYIPELEGNLDRISEDIEKHSKQLETEERNLEANPDSDEIKQKIEDIKRKGEILQKEASAHQKRYEALNKVLGDLSSQDPEEQKAIKNTQAELTKLQTKLNSAVSTTDQ